MSVKSDREHSFDHELATLVGTEKSILMKNFNHWCAHNKRTGQKNYFKDGQWWTAETLDSLEEKYKYMDRGSIARWVDELAATGWLIINKEERKVSFYRPGPIFDLWNAGEDWIAELKKMLSQNETEKNEKVCLKMRRMLSQNEILTVSKRDRRCLKMRHTNIEIDIEGNVEENIPPTGDVFENDNVEDKKEKPIPPCAAPLSNDPADKRAEWIPKRDAIIAEGIAARLANEAEKIKSIERRYLAIQAKIKLEENIDLIGETLNRESKMPRGFDLTLPTTRKPIRARLEKNPVQEVLAVTIFKCKQWRDNPKMRPHLKPSVLYNGHFDEYIVEATAETQAPIVEKPKDQTAYKSPEYFNPNKYKRV